MIFSIYLNRRVFVMGSRWLYVVFLGGHNLGIKDTQVMTTKKNNIKPSAAHYENARKLKFSMLLTKT